VRVSKRLMVQVGLAATYFIATTLGLRLADLNPSATAVWPGTGIALAGFLIVGYGVWPAIFVGAFLVNLTTAGTFFTSVQIALGNTLEGLVGAYLVNRFANGRNAIDRVLDIFKFALLAAGVSTIVSSTIGVTALALAGFVSWSQYGQVWVTWWCGDATGAIIVAPALLLWCNTPLPRRNAVRWAEALAMFTGTIIVALAVFAGLDPVGESHYPLQFFLTPFFVWAALRFGSREAATAILLASLVAWSTLRGSAPSTGGTWDESLLVLQAFMGIMSIMILSLAAETAERQRVEGRLRHLAVSDPLTGLANYRQLVSVIDAEIARGQRTQRAFSILFMDLDGLKGINDRYGHWVGSRALMRVAEALRGLSRPMDTAARFGGDEFALVLPETSEIDARQVAQRVAERLVNDAEKPPITVSVGVAEHPRDGTTTEALIGAADRLLYVVKGRTSRGIHVSDGADGEPDSRSSELLPGPRR
jgi:diguanylate cyclase (GGDEF)-like protein